MGQAGGSERPDTLGRSPSQDAVFFTDAGLRPPMTETDETDRERAERALERHGAFEREGEAFTTTTSAVDARVRVEAVGAGVVFRITARVPTIDAVVAGETVATVVQEGWFETFERRLEDVGGATRADPAAPTATLDEGAEEVVVEAAIEPRRPEGGADDAKAIVDYVEGTFVEGLIPGYTYREPAAGLLERARSAGER